MHTQSEMITPATAKKYLDTMVPNRPFRERYARALAGDIVLGRWKITHQGIAFDKQGSLIDGQHRLWAIIYAQVPVTMMVTRGADYDARDCIDIGRARSFVDIVTIRGDKIGNSEAGTLRAMLSQGWGNISGTSLTVPMLEAEWVKHESCITYIHKLFPTTSAWPKGVNSASIRGAVARAYYSANHNDLEIFVRILLTGFSEDPRGRPVILFRNMIITRTDQRGIMINKRSLYLKCERVLMAYIRHEQLSRIQEASSELFPLPGEELNVNGSGRIES